jgi:Uma2 family endonuclease
MDWAEVLADPSLQDLPYKVETNEWGQIVMTPAKNWHARMQFRVARRLDELVTNGEVFGECSIDTPEGVKVPDVAWASAAYLERNGQVDPYPEAPELCVEVVSRSNSKRQMDLKSRLYFERGAKEFWLCTEKGDVRFFTPDGEIEHSILFPAFPKSLPQ